MQVGSSSGVRSGLSFGSSTFSALNVKSILFGKWAVFSSVSSATFYQGVFLECSVFYVLKFHSSLHYAFFYVMSVLSVSRAATLLPPYPSTLWPCTRDPVGLGERVGVCNVAFSFVAVFVSSIVLFGQFVFCLQILRGQLSRCYWTAVFRGLLLTSMFYLSGELSVSFVLKMLLFVRFFSLKAPSHF